MATQLEKKKAQTLKTLDNIEKAKATAEEKKKMAIASIRILRSESFLGN